MDRVPQMWDPDPGDVYLDSWIGKIEHVVQDVTVVFSDGARYGVVGGRARGGMMVLEK